MNWRKSSYSIGNGECVEVAVLPGAVPGAGYVIALRDSKDPDGPMLTFTPSVWQEFTASLKASV